ncbi:MAG: alkaline phosphatase family protein, partial [Mycobacteriales bacterium]
VNNVFFDRAAGVRVAANESATWHRAVDLLRPGVETVFEAIARSRPDASTACVNEMFDRGAGYSTFVIIRERDSERGAKDMGSLLPDATTDPHATQEWVRADSDYAWSTGVDALGLAQVLQLWDDPRTAPAFTWWNSVLPDTGHHGGGPHSPESRASLRDTDRRLSVFLDHLDRHGVTDDVTILLTADHGSEAADSGCRGDWDDALRAAGIDFRDEAQGFIYLGR